MKKIFKILYPYVLPVSLVVFLLYSFKVIKLEYQFAFQSHQVYQNNFFLENKFYFQKLRNLKIKFLKKKSN